MTRIGYRDKKILSQQKNLCNLCQEALNQLSFSLVNYVAWRADNYYESKAELYPKITLRYG